MTDVRCPTGNLCHVRQLLHAAAALINRQNSFFLLPFALSAHYNRNLMELHIINSWRPTSTKQFLAALAALLCVSSSVDACCRNPHVSFRDVTTVLDPNRSTNGSTFLSWLENFLLPLNPVEETEDGNSCDGPSCSNAPPQSASPVPAATAGKGRNATCLFKLGLALLDDGEHPFAPMPSRIHAWERLKSIFHPPRS